MPKSETTMTLNKIETEHGTVVIETFPYVLRPVPPSALERCTGVLDDWLYFSACRGMCG